MKLNLGCADDLRKDWINVDRIGPADVVTDLTLRWPWEDSTVTEIYAADIFEHLPDRVHTMNECWRVLIPYGTATIIVPSAAKGAGFFQDPDHKSPWVMNSFQYFEHGSYAHRRLARSYGITAAFRIKGMNEQLIDDRYEQVYKITAALEAVK